MGARAARPYLKNLAQRETGNRNVTCGHHTHLQVPGLGSQVSGTGVQAQVRVPGEIQILNLYPNLKTRTRLPAAETRDLKWFRFPPLHCLGLISLALEPSCPQVLVPSGPPVPGFPLSAVSLWSTEPPGLSLFPPLSTCQLVNVSTSAVSL
jgi:hypothetical protein